jgi:hypothetical protein
MIECGHVAECRVVQPSSEATAPEMPTSIPGYEPESSPTRSEVAVFGDGSASKGSEFPYLLGDCALQIWTARWRSVTGEQVSGAVIPGTPETPFEQPWQPAWGEVPAPSLSGFLAGYGCSQPAWAFTDADPESTIVSDIVVEWQIWHASP